VIALNKKPHTTKCSDHHRVSAIAHTAKIVAMILRRRVERKIENVLGEDQFKFRRDAGYNIRMNFRHRQGIVYLVHIQAEGI